MPLWEKMNARAVRQARRVETSAKDASGIQGRPKRGEEGLNDENDEMEL